MASDSADKNDLEASVILGLLQEYPYSKMYMTFL